MGKKPFVTKKLAFLDTKYEICVVKREKMRCNKNKNIKKKVGKHALKAP